MFFLPPGRYRVEAQVGTENVKASTEVEVPAGRDTKINFKLPSAELTVMPRTGPPGSGAPWQVKDEKGETVLHSGAVDSAPRALPLAAMLCKHRTRTAAGAAT